MKRLVGLLLLGLVVVSVGQKAKDFNLTDRDGKKYNLFSMLGEGKHVIIHFTSEN